MRGHPAVLGWYDSGKWAYGLSSSGMREPALGELAHGSQSRGTQFKDQPVLPASIARGVTRRGHHELMNTIWNPEKKSVESVEADSTAPDLVGE